jgi:hypothetical protein
MGDSLLRDIVTTTHGEFHGRPHLHFTFEETNLSSITQVGTQVSMKLKPFSLYNKYIILPLTTSAVQNSIMKTYKYIFPIAENLCVSVYVCVCV